jgi:hypothetical protein
MVMAGKKTPPLEPRYDSKNRKLCTARKKSTKELCNAAAMSERDVCYHHGGKTPRGTESPHFITGRHSRFGNSPELQKIYESLLNDPTIDLFSADDDMYALMARRHYLEGQGEDRAQWQHLKKLWPTLWVGLQGKATDTQKKAGLRAAIQINDFFNEGVKNSDKWDEHYRIDDLLDKMRDRAFARAIKGEMLLRADYALALYAPLLMTLKEIIIDYNRQNKVADAGIIVQLQEQWQRGLRHRTRQLAESNPE